MPWNNNEVLRLPDLDVEWLWEVQFIGAPSPWDKRLAALDVNLGLWTVNPEQFNIASTTASIPASTEEHDISITFLDTTDIGFVLYLESWINSEIFPRLGVVTNLTAIKKQVVISKFDRQLRMVKRWKKEVFPTGSSGYSGTGDSSGMNYSLDLKVVGKF